MNVKESISSLSKKNYTMYQLISTELDITHESILPLWKEENKNFLCI